MELAASAPHSLQACSPCTADPRSGCPEEFSLLGFHVVGCTRSTEAAQDEIGADTAVLLRAVSGTGSHPTLIRSCWHCLLFVPLHFRYTLQAAGWPRGTPQHPRAPEGWLQPSLCLSWVGVAKALLGLERVNFIYIFFFYFFPRQNLTLPFSPCCL